MYNCIYSGHCSQATCDKSCPTLVETTYLLERNNIPMSSNVFNRSKAEVDKYYELLAEAQGKTKAIIENNSTIATADLVTYCSICQNWRGSRLHCTVYNLRYSQYVESIRKTWSTNNEPEELEYMRIWSSSAKVLIISNLDYVHFRDFECQTLLNLIQEREGKGLTTIIISPPVIELVGTSLFMKPMRSMITKAVSA